MNHKNSLIVVVAALLCFSVMASIASADQITVYIDDASGGYDDTVDVSILISNAGGVGSLDLVFTYDPTLLQAQAVTKGDVVKGMISSNIETAGIVSIGIVDQNGIDEDGEIAVVSFTVLEQDGSSPLRIEQLLVYDIDSLEMNARSDDGTFRITDRDSDETPGFIVGVFVFSVLVVFVLGRGKKR